MERWISKFSLLALILFLASFDNLQHEQVVIPEALKVKENVPVIYPQKRVIATGALTIPPFLGTSYIGFKEALAFKESSGNYFTINSLGYLGRYQFGIGTLQLMGVYNATQFLNDPRLQERVFHTNIARNKWILRRDIERYSGKRIGGQLITESGILAAAHLAGAGNVRRYLRSYGEQDRKDAYGTSISDYIRKFSGYDVSEIPPKRNARI